MRRLLQLGGRHRLLFWFCSFSHSASENAFHVKNLCTILGPRIFTKHLRAIVDVEKKLSNIFCTGMLVCCITLRKDFTTTLHIQAQGLFGYLLVLVEKDHLFTKVWYQIQVADFLLLFLFTKTMRKDFGSSFSKFTPPSPNSLFCQRYKANSHFPPCFEDLWAVSGDCTNYKAPLPCAPSYGFGQSLRVGFMSAFGRSW